MLFHLSLTKDRTGPGHKDDTIAYIWRSSDFNSVERGIVETRSRAVADSLLSSDFFVIICRWKLKADSAQGSPLSYFQSLSSSGGKAGYLRPYRLCHQDLVNTRCTQACSGHAHLCDSSVFNSGSANFIIPHWIFLPSFHLQEDYSPVISFFFPLFTPGLCLNVIRSTPCPCVLCLESQTSKR